MCDTPEEEKFERPCPPLRVPVTPEWLAEQVKKQRRYEQKRTAWLARMAKPDK